MKNDIIKFIFYVSGLLNIQNILLLYTALMDLPYEYYIFLRYSVFIGMIVNIITFILARKEYTIPKIIYACIAICIGVAVLFNPIEPIHLSRGLWKFIDAAIPLYLGFCLIMSPIGTLK